MECICGWFLAKLFLQIIVFGTMFLATLAYLKPHFIIPAMVKLGVFLSPLKKRYVSLKDGYWASYLEFGSVEKCPETLVFIHGFSGSAVDFLQHLRHLGKDKHMVFVNFLNHGDTMSLDRDVTMADLVDYVDQIVQFTGLELRKFHIVGFSMGGGVAIQYASQKPDLVASLFLINPYGLYDQSNNTNFKGMPDMHYSSNEEFSQMFEKMSNGAMKLPWWIVGALRHHKNNTARKELHVMRGQRQRPSLMDKSFLEALCKSDIPVMYVQGEADVITPKDGLDYFMSHVPNASYSLIEEGSHCILYTHVQQICGMLNNWIKKVGTLKND